MKSKSAAHRKNQRGIAMVVVMIALFLLAAIGAGLMFMADTENSINSNYRDSQKAYFAARAGAEDVRALLAPGGTLNTSAMNLAMPNSTGTGIIYVLNPLGSETVTPSGTASNNTVATNPYLDDEFCQEQYANLVTTITPVTVGPCSGSTHVITHTSYYTTATLSTTDSGLNSSNSGSDALAFKWVRINNKQNYMAQFNQNVDGTTPSSTNKGLQVCWNGFNETSISSGSCTNQFPMQMEPVWQVTSLAVTRPIGNNPGSRRLIQMEVANTPPVSAPAPLAAQAPIKVQGSFTANAYNACKCLPNGARRGVSGGAVPDPSCVAPTTAVYSAQTITDSGSGSLNATGANGNTGTNALSQDQPWPYNVSEMISAYAGAPGTVNVTGPPYNMTCGSSGCGKVTGKSGITFGTYPTGGYPAPQPAGGTGLATGQSPQTTYFPGSVEFNADVNGAGIMVINGDLTVDGGFNFYGLVLVSGHIKYSGGGSQKVNVYGAILAGEDISDDTDTVGGSFSFYYDACALNQLNTNSPPRLLASHELMY